MYFPFHFLVSASHVQVMASSCSQNSSHTTYEGTSIPATPSGNVIISTCSTGLKYNLYPVEVIFPSLKEPWVCNEHDPSRMITAIFSKRVELEEFEG